MSAMDALLVRMNGIGAGIPADDPRTYFHATYTRTTRAVADEIRRGGFRDGEWVERWDVTFAELYLDAFESWERDGVGPGPWDIAFAATRGKRLPPLRHVLLGMNAHINYDLPQALIAVIGAAEFADAEVLALRGEDHRHIDSVLAARVAAEDAELATVERPGDRTLLDRLLQPLNRLGTKRFLAEARAKVWHNARALDEARRLGPDALAGRVTELEALSRQRVADLTRPGQVLLELTLRGFGVTLP